MGEGKKISPAIIIIPAALVALALATRVKAAPPPPGEGAASIVIQVYDSQGKLVPPSSPVALDEGSTYTVKLTVKNNSTKGGIPWEATLGIGISAATPLITLISPREDMKSFGAGETKSFNYTLNIPMGAGNQSGSITAWVEDPYGIVIANAQEPLAIRELSIVYGATIVIG